MKINLPIFKDEDAKDAVTYQSWRWDLTVYRHAGCRDHTLLPYAIRSLQGYPGELVWSSGTDITLDDVLMILDEHYNNVKVLDTLNQELFQMREAEKEDSIKLSRSSRSQPTDGPSKPRTTSFFPLRKLKGSQPFPKKPAVRLAQLDEEDADNGKDPDSDDPDGIKGVTKDFMVWLARAVKDAQMDEKHCYHCSSSKHFIRNCLLMKTARDKKQLNGKEGMATMKGAQTPPKTMSAITSPQKEAQEA